MKCKSVLATAFLFWASLLYSQDTIGDTSYWHFSGNTQLLFNQAVFHQWASGGENTIGLTAVVDLNLTHEKEKHIWENKLYLAYGRTRQGDITRKNEDKIEFHSKYNLKSNSKFEWATQLNFVTQFDKGYNYPNDSVAVSKFLSPGYLVVATGIDYKPASYFTLNLSPLSFKSTFVTDTSAIDHTIYGIKKDKFARNEMGGLLKASFKKEVMKNIEVFSQLSFFSDYLNNPTSIDIYWILRINMKINEWFGANITAELYYDEDISVPRKGPGETISYGPGVQFKELLGIGLTYKFK